MTILFKIVNLPEEASIAILIAASVVGLWLLLLITDIGFVLTFKAILKKHIKSLTVILNTKYLNLLKIFEKAKESGIEVNEKVDVILKEMDQLGFSKHDSELGERMRAYLSYLGEEARFILIRNKEAFKDGEFEIIQSNLKDIEIQLRSNIAMYNADILGFNYWIHFLPTRFIYKMLKIKKKELIS